MKTRDIIIVSMLVGILLFIVLFIALTPTGRAIFTRYGADLEKSEQINTNDAQRKIEDEARAMVASYESDVLIYNQYKDSQNREEHSWGQNAKIRANLTAKSYEAFIKNSYNEQNIPDDLPRSLPIVE